MVSISATPWAGGNKTTHALWERPAGTVFFCYSDWDDVETQTGSGSSLMTWLLSYEMCPVCYWHIRAKDRLRTCTDANSHTLRALYPFTHRMRCSAEALCLFWKKAHQWVTAVLCSIIMWNVSAAFRSFQCRWLWPYVQNKENYFLTLVTWAIIV